MKKILLFYLFSFVLAYVGAAQNPAVHVNVYMTSGQIEMFSFDESSSMYFVDDSLLVIDTYDDNVQIPIDDIRKITFDEVWSLNPTSDVADSYVIYPNPARDMLTVRMTYETEMLEIYSVQGTLLYEVVVSDGSEVDLSMLSAGTYIVKIGVKYQKLVKL